MPGLIFSGSEGVGSRFHVLRAHTRFQRYRGRRVSFSCFTRPDSFWTVPAMSGPVFLFRTPRLVFRLYRGHRVPFSYFAHPDSFLSVPRASGPVFMFCAPELIFGGAEGVVTRFHGLCSRTHFRRCRVCQVPFSCLVLQDSFSTVPRASGPVFVFCAPGLVFICIEVVGSPFHVLRSRTHFRRFRGSSGLVFISCASGLIFGGIECVRSRFHVFRSRTCFRRYRGRRVPFSCFALPNSFSMVPWASGPVFTFYVPGLVFGDTGGVRSVFHVLCAQTLFQLYRGHQAPFSCFALPDSFSAVPRASGPIFMFCAHGLIFGGTESVRSRFHVFRSPTCFRRYQGRQVLFSCFALPESFSAVPWASDPVFTFYIPELVFGGTRGVRSHFHVLRTQTRF
jgi:hypothetical protein